ncbi:MAG: Hpt domain-containing protein [Rhodobacteraceae bacterium]|nr:Hpt domain-containing protein [Paracoccaceae bacterium]
MIMQQDAIRAAIDRIRPRYRASLIEFEARLVAALDDLQRLGASEANLGEIRFVAHRIAGTAASFGWPVLGAVAMTVDAALASVSQVDAGAPPDVAAVHHMLAELRRSLGQ